MVKIQNQIKTDVEHPFDIHFGSASDIFCLTKMMSLCYDRQIKKG